jgi:hypothetical protein
MTTTGVFPIVTADVPTPNGRVRCTTCDRLITIGQPYEVRPMGFRDRGPDKAAGGLSTITCVYCPAPDDVCAGALEFFASCDGDDQ